MPSDPDQIDDDDLAGQAESVWFAAVDLVAEGTPDLLELCRQHPALADELRQISADWSWLQEHISTDGEGDQDGAAELIRLVRGFDHERYARIEEMARGGGGRIDRIWDALLQRSLAMKVAMVRAPEQRASRSRSLARFLEEAQVTGQLQHPGIVPVHDVGIDDDGFAFFTMNLVEGIDLGEAFRLARAGAEDWTLQRAVRALASVTDTLAYAHHRGVLHRDVKPSNVRVGPFGEVYVMDWGLARVAGARDRQAHADGVQSVRSGSSTGALLTSEGAVIGTPAYMPPEQARGALSELDERTDVYAVGAMLYELLAGRPPYAEEQQTSTPEELAAAVASSAPPSLEDLAPGATPGLLVSIASRAMARRPGDRYQDMAQLGVELRAFLEGRVVHAHRTGALVEIQKWVLRNRLSAAALALFVLALGTAAWIQYDRSRELRGVNRELSTTNEDLELARTEALSEAHFARLAAAQASLRAGNARSARSHLSACASEMRGWGWRHIWSRARNNERRFEIEVGLAAPGSFDRSSDGRFAAGQNLRVPKLQYEQEFVNELCLYALDEGTRSSLLEFRGGAEVRFVPGTALLVSATREGVHVLDCEQGGASVATVEAPLDGLETILLAVSANGLRLVHRAGSESFAVANSRDLQQVEICEPDARLGQVSSIAISPDGALLAALNRQGMLHLIEAGGHVVASIDTGESDRTSYPPPLSFAADGTSLAAGMTDGTLELFDIPGGRPAASIAASKEHISAVAFSPSGRNLACGAWDGTVSVFDTLTGAAIFRGYGHESMVVELGWEPDGEELWSASRDGTLRTWRPDRGNGFDTLRTRTGVDIDYAIDPERPRIATRNTDGVLQLWDTLTGDLIARCDFTLLPRFSPLSAVFVPGSGDVVVSTRLTGMLRLGADTLELVASGDPVGGQLLTISGDGQRLAYRARGGARVARVEDLSVEARIACTEEPSAIAFCPQGDALWIGDTSGELSQWSLASGTPERRVSLNMNAGVVGLASNDEFLAVGLTDGRIELCSVADGSHVAEFGAGSGPVESLDFHPLEALLISSGRTSSGDSNLRLWDTERHQLRCELIGPEGRLSSARFGGDGSWIVARMTQPKGLALIDSVPRHRGTELVEVARERVRPRVEALREEWPHPRALARIWDLQQGLDTHERRAGRSMAFEHPSPMSKHLAALAGLLSDPDKAARHPEASALLARHVAKLARHLPQKITALRVLLAGGHTEEASGLLQALQSALTEAPAETQRSAEELTSEIDAALGD